MDSNKPDEIFFDHEIYESQSLSCVVSEAEIVVIDVLARMAHLLNFLSCGSFQALTVRIR